MVIELFQSHFSHSPTSCQAKWSLSTHDVLHPEKISETVAKLRGQPDAAFSVFTLSRKGPGSDPDGFVASVARYTGEDLHGKLNTVAEIRQQRPHDGRPGPDA